MLIKDFKKDFYDTLQRQRVLVLVAFDVDALCACKILQYLFHCDQVVYTVVPVDGLQSLEQAYLENAEGIRQVVLINCGATVDIVELLQPEEFVKFYICDSHRPVDIHNFYNAVQVKLLMREDELSSIPSYDEVFRDDEEDSDQSEEENEDPDSGYKKKRFDDESILRRQERRRWNEERCSFGKSARQLCGKLQSLNVSQTPVGDKRIPFFKFYPSGGATLLQRRVRILFDYTKFTSYGTSVAMVMFESAWKLSKDTNNLLWLAIVGVTDQYVHFKTPRDKYMEDIISLQSHVSRHNYRGAEGENLLSVNCLRISFEEELHLNLYRHWTLFDSICHSMPIACKLRLWTLKGQKRLHEFLAEMGLPIVQCKQQFSAMDISLRSEVKTRMQEYMNKYGLESQDIILPSFSMQFGYKNLLCATDYVLACAATLESLDSSKLQTDNFLLASDILQRSSPEKTDKAIDAAKAQLKSLASQVQSSLDMHQIISAGPFLYVFVQEGTADSRIFSQPLSLIRLARFTLQAHCSVTRNKKAYSLPLVLGAPLSLEEGTCLIIGIPPLDTDDERKNFFGKAFEQAAQSTNMTVKCNGFDTFIIEMRIEDRSKFFDALISILQ